MKNEDINSWVYALIHYRPTLKVYLTGFQTRYPRIIGRIFSASDTLYSGEYRDLQYVLRRALPSLYRKNIKISL